MVLLLIAFQKLQRRFRAAGAARVAAAAFFYRFQNRGVSLLAVFLNKKRRALGRVSVPGAVIGPCRNRPVPHSRNSRPGLFPPSRLDWDIFRPQTGWRTNSWDRRSGSRRTTVPKSNDGSDGRTRPGGRSPFAPPGAGLP